MPANRTRDEDTEPEQVAQSTVRDATHELESADALRLALLHGAEQQRAEGPRTSVLERVARRRAAEDDRLVTAGSGIDQSEIEHYAALWNVDYSILRATFALLGRKRVDADELRAAVTHVGGREV